MQIKNIEKGPRGLNTKAGSVLVDPGKVVDVELSKEELASAKRTGWFEFGDVAEDEPEDAGALKAVHRGGGRFSIMRGDEEVRSGLTKAEADAFNALSDEEKAEEAAA